MAHLASVILSGTTRATVIEPISVNPDQRALDNLSRLRTPEGLAAGIVWEYRGFWVIMTAARDRGAVFDISVTGSQITPDSVLVVISNAIWPAPYRQWPTIDLDYALCAVDRWVLTYNSDLSELYPTPPELLRNTALDYAKRLPDQLGVDKIPNVIHSIEDEIAWKLAADAYRKAQI